MDNSHDRGDVPTAAHLMPDGDVYFGRNLSLTSQRKGADASIYDRAESRSVNRREIVTPDRRQILTPYSRCLKRQESFPVSMISQ